MLRTLNDGRGMLPRRLTAALATAALTGSGLFSLVGLSALTAAPAMAAAPTTNGALPSRNGQVLYAYVEQDGSLDVSATWHEKSRYCDGNYVDEIFDEKVQIRVTDPTGAVSRFPAKMTGCKNVTISQSDLEAVGGQAGVWKIEFVSLADDGSDSPIGFDGRALGLDEKVNIPISKWSVSPKSASGTVQAGRVWTNRVDANQDKQAGLTDAVDVSLWYLSNTGVQYSAQFNDYMGIESYFMAASKGVLSSTCEPLMGSEDQTEKPKTVVDCPAVDYTPYRLFFAAPDETMPRTAQWFDGTTKWVFADYAEPTLSDPVYDNASDGLTHSGSFTATLADQFGDVTGMVDTNGDGDFDDAVDIQLATLALAADETGTWTWDGLDGNGDPVPATRKINVGVKTASVGEIHFVSSDVEQRRGGIEVTQLVGPDVGSHLLSWDDKTYLVSGCLENNGDGSFDEVACAGTKPSPLKAKLVDSSGGVHRWGEPSSDYIEGTWGDSRTIDDWAFMSDAAEALVPVNLGSIPLSIVKDDHQGVVAPGQELTYELEVTNGSDTLAEPEALVVDHLPAELDFVEASDGGTYDAATRTITWPAFELAPSSTATRTVTATVALTVERPGEFTNYATVQGTDTDVPPSDPASEDCKAPLCTSDTDTTVMADLMVTKDDHQVIVMPEQILTYDIEATNNASVVEPEALLVDTLPAELVFISASDGGTYDAATRTIAWPRFELAANSTATRTVTAAVNLAVTRPGVFVNFVTIAPTGEDPVDPSTGCTSPRCGSDTDQVPPPAVLSIAKDDHRELVEPGEELTYDIAAANTSATAEPSATIVDTLPAELDFVEASDGGVYDPASRTVTWTGVAITGGSTVTRTVTATVGETVARPGEFTNFVVIAGNGSTPGDPSTGCEAPLCGSDTDHTALADVRIVKTVTDAVLAKSGRVSWQVEVGNFAEESTAHQVVVTDTFPAAIDPASIEGLDPSKGTWTGGLWQVGDLAPGETATITLTGVVLDDLTAGESLLNTARVTSPDDPTKGDPTAAICEDNASLASDTDGCDEVELVPPPAVLSIAKDDHRELVEPGEELTYDIAAANTSATAEPSATIVDTLPAELDFVEASDGGVYDPASRTVTWTGVAITGGSTVTRTVTATVGETVARPGEFTNFVVIAGNGSTPGDPSTGCEAPLCGSDTDHTALADVRIVKTVTDAVLAKSGRVSWQVEVGNFAEESTAHQVVVTDTFPAAIDPASIEGLDPSKGTWTGGLWQVGDLAPGETATITLTGVVLDDLTAGESLLNTARVTSPDDPTKGDPTAAICEDNASLASDTDGCDEVELVPGTTLVVSKDDGRVVVAPGDQLVYEIVGTNTGRVIEPAALLTDTLPVEVTFVEASDGGTWDAATRTITWPRAAVKPGESLVRTVTVTVNEDVARPDEFTNFVTIVPEGVDPVDPTDPTVGCEAPGCASDTDRTEPVPVPPTEPTKPDTGINTGVPGVPNQPLWLVGLGAATLAGAVGAGTWLVTRRVRKA